MFVSYVRTHVHRELLQTPHEVQITVRRIQTDRSGELSQPDIDWANSCRVPLTEQPADRDFVIDSFLGKLSGHDIWRPLSTCLLAHITLVVHTMSNAQFITFYDIPSTRGAWSPNTWKTRCVQRLAEFRVAHTWDYNQVCAER